jgi:hypothetical protein
MMVWLWYDDHPMMIWWWSDVDMMVMIWQCYADVMMMIWWWYDDDDDTDNDDDDDDDDGELIMMMAMTTASSRWQDGPTPVRFALRLQDARRAGEPAEHQWLPSGSAWGRTKQHARRGNTGIFRPWHVSLMFASEGRALQLKDRMP